MTGHRFAITALSAALLALGSGCPSGSQSGQDKTGPGGGAGGPGGSGGPGEPGGGESLPAFPEQAFRAEQPEATEPRSFQLPEVQHFELDRGVEVYLIEQHDLPTISIELNFEGGSRNDPRGKEGLASVCMDMLTEGTRELDKIAFREALADTASRIGSYAGSETQGVTMATLTKHFDETFALFSDVLQKPGFRKSDLDRMVSRRLDGLKQAKATPSSVAARLRPVLVYGRRHPFGRLTTEKSLQSIRIADCKRYHRAYLKPRGVRLFVVGDMTREQIEEGFAPLLKRWRGKPRRSAKLPAPKPPEGRIFFVDIPSAEQSSIYLVHPGPQRKAEDYFATQMMARILAGGFTSRLNMNLREDKGYAYGAGGGFRYAREIGHFVAATRVEVKATRQSVVEMFSELSDLHGSDRPATKAELEREKLGAIEALPAGFATARQALSRYRTLVYYGLPLDYYNDYIDRVSSVTLAQVAGAAGERLLPEKTRILVVGNGDAEQIRREGKEDVTLEDAGGNPLKLLGALTDLSKSGEVGKGKLVLMDPDGKVLETYE